MIPIRYLPMNGMKNIVEVFPILRSSEEGGPGDEPPIPMLHADSHLRPKIGSSHGRRNELHFSSEVPPDGSSWHKWLRHEVELAPHRQPAAWEEREVAGSSQGFFAL